MEQLRYHSYYYDTYDFEREEMLWIILNSMLNKRLGAFLRENKRKSNRKRLSIRSEVIIIDEITAVLDPETRLRFFTLLAEIHKRKQCSIILATNLVEDLKNRVDRVIFIDKSKASHANPSEIDNFLIFRNWKPLHERDHTSSRI